MSSSRLSPKSMYLFYSYSHKDARLCKELAAHLSLLKRQGIIQDWSDRDIDAGREWEHTIHGNLEKASIILLLISADFLASDYCYAREMTRALERHSAGEARTIPIILRAVDWKGAPFSALQALPTNARPITSWSKRDEAWASVAIGIRKAVEELTINFSKAQVEITNKFGTELIGNWKLNSEQLEAVKGNEVLVKFDKDGGLLISLRSETFLRAYMNRLGINVIKGTWMVHKDTLRMHLDELHNSWFGFIGKYYLTIENLFTMSNVKIISLNREKFVCEYDGKKTELIRVTGS